MEQFRRNGTFENPGQILEDNGAIMKEIATRQVLSQLDTMMDYKDEVPDVVEVESGED